MRMKWRPTASDLLFFPYVAVTGVLAVMLTTHREVLSSWMAGVISGYMAASLAMVGFMRWERNDAIKMVRKMLKDRACKDDGKGR